MRNMHGVGFPNATYSVHTDRHERRSLARAPPSSCSTVRPMGPTGPFSRQQSAAGGTRASRGDAAYTDTGLRVRRGVLLHITISIHSLKFSLGMSTAARFVSVLSRPFYPSLQVSVFQVPVLEGKALLLPLAPFLIVKVNVSALEEEHKSNH